jgi:4-hydroxy-4-methyl-2-oxoglutarate aldolase
MPVTVHAVPADALTPAEIECWRRIPVAVAVDVSHGSCQIDPAIRPVCPPGRQPRMFGRAVTARCEPPDFGAVLHALDLINPTDVLVIAAGGHADTAMIGEILGGQVRRLKGGGIVCDGAVRDVAELVAFSDLAVFARFITPRGPTGAEHGSVNAPVLIGGRLVSPGDLMIGDDDGLACLVPDSVRGLIKDAKAKLALEADWQARLAGGQSVAEIFGLPAPQRSR